MLVSAYAVENFNLSGTKVKNYVYVFIEEIAFNIIIYIKKIKHMKSHDPHTFPLALPTF